jgi:hypothetical protein
MVLQAKSRSGRSKDIVAPTDMLPGGVLRDVIYFIYVIENGKL